MATARNDALSPDTRLAKHRPVTPYRLTLILAGAVSVALIAAAIVLRHAPETGTPLLVTLLLGAYALGLGLGRLVFNRN